MHVNGYVNIFWKYGDHCAILTGVSQSREGVLKRRKSWFTLCTYREESCTPYQTEPINKKMSAVAEQGSASLMYPERRVTLITGLSQSISRVLKRSRGGPIMYI